MTLLPKVSGGNQMSDRNDVLTQLAALDAHLRDQGTSVASVLNQAAVRILGLMPYEPVEAVPYAEPERSQVSADRQFDPPSYQR